ncbi:ABC transporter ATP-binding protein [Helicovermis profundi]|uniref:ABC transporter ATP-binding protein n=1 Tax=Helicovermis profundi TaxID=3065157 RepID=A0AAU9ETP0_9FIRM|nr:ABC transporter ATP-binding protein [Clostridia bacterium S502]
MENRNKNNSRPQARPMGRGHSMMRATGPKAKNFKGTLKKLIKYLSVYKYSIFVVVIFAIISSAFSIIGPKLLGNITTKIFSGVMKMISGSKDTIDFVYIKKITLILVGLYGLSTIFSYFQRYIMAGVSMKVSYNMRQNISKKINRIPLKYFDGTNHGEVLSRITNDVDTVSRTLSQSLSQIITSVATVIGVLIMMFSISPLMTLVALLILPLSMVLVMQVVKRSQKLFKKQQDYLGHINGHIEEIYSSHLIVKAYNGEEKSLVKFDTMNEELYDSAWKSQFLSSLMMPMMNIIGNIGYVAVAVLGGFLAAIGRISVGDIQAFIQYVRNFTQPMAQIANISNVLQQTVAASERVFEFLEEKEKVEFVSGNAQSTLKEKYDKNASSISKTSKGRVSFKNVHFGYSEDKIIINDFSADIKEGEKIAIVGPTGAGKTTMVKLLMRYYDVNSGSILIDGVNVKDMSRKELRTKLGMVLQDTWLYNTSIMENIRYGRLDASDEEVIEAAKKSHVDTFVNMLPDGYNMILNEDTNNISQGQKQLITIARVMLNNPNILILDEATSSVDTRTEVQIQASMDRLMHGKTSFIIAHRLSTIRDADLILVMNNGDIVEQGNHSELLSRNGFYATLYNSQFEHVS